MISWAMFEGSIVVLPVRLVGYQATTHVRTSCLERRGPRRFGGPADRMPLSPDTSVSPTVANACNSDADPFGAKPIRTRPLGREVQATMANIPTGSVHGRESRPQ